MEIFFVNPGNHKKERAEKKNLSVYLEKKPFHIIIEFDKERIIGLTEVKRLLALYKEMLNHVKSQANGDYIYSYFFRFIQMF